MGFPQIATFEPNAILPKVFGVHIGWIIAIFIVLAISFLLAKTKKGFEISVIGESIDTARYAGMNVKHVIVAAIILSGGICGIVGMMEASGVNRTLSSNVSSGYGFTAIITTWLSGLKASIIIPVSILFAGLIKGGSFIQTAYGIPQSASDVLQALILFFIIGSEFFVQYRLVPSTAKEEL
jgi:simple sugar transport system permease protein